MSQNIRSPFPPAGYKSLDGVNFRMDVESSKENLHKRIFCKLKQMSNTMEKNVGEIATEWKTIQEVMDYAATHCKASWVDAKDNSPKWISDIRGIRMALTSEVNMIKQSIKDIEDATTGEAAQKRIAAVKDLVDLCERLRAVQNDGTFDKVLDVLLKH